MEIRIGGTGIEVFAGDISRQEVDAIVNPTVSTLLSSDPVALSIRKAGGLGFLKECRYYTARNGNVPAGAAVLTGAGGLAARFVIHAVAPEWSGGRQREDRILRRLYWHILRRAEAAGASSVAIPAVGAGLQGIPVGVTARVAFSTVCGYLLKERSLREIRFVLVSRYDVETYAGVWDAIGRIDPRPLSSRYA